MRGREVVCHMRGECVERRPESRTRQGLVRKSTMREIGEAGVLTESACCCGRMEPPHEEAGRRSCAAARRNHLTTSATAGGTAMVREMKKAERRKDRRRASESRGGAWIENHMKAGQESCAASRATPKSSRDDGTETARWSRRGRIDKAAGRQKVPTPQKVRPPHRRDGATSKGSPRDVRCGDEDKRELTQRAPCTLCEHTTHICIRCTCVCRVNSLPAQLWP